MLIIMNGDYHDNAEYYENGDYYDNGDYYENRDYHDYNSVHNLGTSLDLAWTDYVRTKLESSEKVSQSCKKLWKLNKL